MAAVAVVRPQLLDQGPATAAMDPVGTASGRAPSSPPNSSTPSTPASTTRAGSCCSNSTSKPGCGGANSPNCACTTSTPPPGCSPLPGRSRDQHPVPATRRPRFAVNQYPKDKEHRRGEVPLQTPPAPTHPHTTEEP